MHLRSGKSLPNFENCKTRKKMVRPSTSLNVNQSIPEGQPSQSSGNDANVGSGNGSTTLNQNTSTTGSSGPSVILERIPTVPVTVPLIPSSSAHLGGGNFSQSMNGDQ